MALLKMTLKTRSVGICQTNEVVPENSPLNGKKMALVDQCLTGKRHLGTFSHVLVS